VATAGVIRHVLERQVSRVLGVERGQAAEMLAGLRERRTTMDFSARAVSFLAATSRPARLLPARVRERPVQSLVGQLLQHPGDVLFYIGESAAVPAGPCRGLVED
jgi:hypothetical protein